MFTRCLFGYDMAVENFRKAFETLLTNMLNEKLLKATEGEAYVRKKLLGGRDTRCFKVFFH